MGYADEYLLNLLNEYKMMKERQQKELKSLPAGKLVIRKEKGKMNFVHYLTEKESGAGKIRRGITKQPEMIRALARKQYLQESLSLLQKNIPALESLLKKHLEPTPDNLLKKLPKSWQQLPAGLFSSRKSWKPIRSPSVMSRCCTLKTGDLVRTLPFSTGESCFTGNTADWWEISST